MVVTCLKPLPDFLYGHQELDIDHALSDADRFLRADAFSSLARNTSEQLTQEQIESALSDDDHHVRVVAFSSLAADAPEELTQERIRRSLFNNVVNQRYWLYPGTYNHYIIKRFVFPSNKFNKNAFFQLPFARNEYLQNGYMNKMSRSEHSMLDGRLFSALPDNILQHLDARVLNNLSPENKARLGMRVFAKLSDEAFDDLDNNIFWPGFIISALSADPLTFNPQAFADLPEKRQQRLAECERWLDY